MTRHRIWIQVVLFNGAYFLAASAVHALPLLDEGKFFAPASLFTTTGWSYTGTLPSVLNAGFRAKNIDDDWFGDSGVQYVTGNRSMTTTAGAAPSYSLSLRGEFEQNKTEAWDNSLLDQSKGVKQDDIDKVEFPAPGGTTTNEHPIPENWRSLDGYANPSGSYAKFDQTLTLSRSYLEPGQFGCPQVVSPGGAKTGHCAFTEAYFKGGANLQASLQGYGSIENIFPGTQSVNVNAKANRITTFKVNDDALYTGQINGTASSFKLEEEKVNSIDFSFAGNFQEQSISVGASVQWDGSGNTSNFDASYVQRVEMSDYVNVGRADKYLLEVRDDPQLSAGLSGTNFDKAKVLASSGLSAIDAFLAPVFQPLASSRLVIKDASTFNLKSSRLPIPLGGFKDDLSIFLHFLLGNEGSIDLVVDGFNFRLFDEDPLFRPFPNFDDLLASITKDLNFIIPPNSSRELGFFLSVPSSALNSAVDSSDKSDGNTLQLAGTGTFQFHDIYGSREKAFALAIPEPNIIHLFVIGLMLLVSVKKRGIDLLNGG